MADIKQAAKWIAQEKKIRRPCFPVGAYVVRLGRLYLHYFDQNGKRRDDLGFILEDLTESDWEIAE